jgi:galactokinase
MSSSSGFMVAVYLLLAKINRLSEWEQYRRNIRDGAVGIADLAAYLATIENGRSFGGLAGDLGVGTLGGSEDHTALLCSEAGRIGQFSYCPITLEMRLPVSADLAFAVGISGVVAEKTGDTREKYNKASRLASKLLEIWRMGTGKSDPTLAAALHSSPDAPEQLKSLIHSETAKALDAAALQARLKHFLVENDEVIPNVDAALAAADRQALGHWVDQSQEAAKELLGNQVAETIFLAAEARRQGAIAASAFGAGFGGSVWALIERDRAEAFLSAWGVQYREHFPVHIDASQFFLTEAGPAAFFVELE